MIHVAFEGVDGSGKSTLLRRVHTALPAHGLSSAAVGKRDEPAATAMTEIIVGNTAVVGPQTETYLRIAREHQRLDQAPAVQVVLLDRSLASLAAMIEAASLQVEDYAAPLRRLRSRMPVLMTVHCHPPFDIARKRLEARVAAGKSMSRKERRGYEYNERIGRAIERWTRTPWLSGHRLAVDTHALDEASSLRAALTAIVAEHRRAHRRAQIGSCERKEATA